MNKLEFADLRKTLLHHLRLKSRLLDYQRRVTTFSRNAGEDALQRVFVINLDRRPDRWRRVRRELDRFRDRENRPLSGLTRRFSAIDARYLEDEPDRSRLSPTYTLADQLTVDPNPLLTIDADARSLQIHMTRPEIAVALSHIEVWRLIADGDVQHALILEDDVFMCYGFADKLQRTWNELDRSEGTGFDILYLAFNEVGELETSEQGEHSRKLDSPGIWEASAYVLSRQGARKLLDTLPAFGPIDLWLNLQFEHVNAFTTASPIVEQRIDEPSTNSYSVLPILSQVGVITGEKPLLPSAKKLPNPVIAFGNNSAELANLGTALSMLGYTCISNVDQLPENETKALSSRGARRSFNAYVDIGSFDSKFLELVAKTNSNARFIGASEDTAAPVSSTHFLAMNPNTKDKWEILTKFLGLEYPAWTYPNDLPVKNQMVLEAAGERKSNISTDLRFDKSPWILSKWEQWGDVIYTDQASRASPTDLTSVGWTVGERIDGPHWTLRDDTFPSNLALFTPNNVAQGIDGAELEIRKELTHVRRLTSGAIASASSYCYGRFSAEFCPPRVSGLVTGMFLYRNGPRQEIDIEFLGKDTTKMLVNVFYNPGPEGTKLEYGYRGTPTLIELGFDAADNFHTYEIDWRPDVILWLVDGRVVHRRSAWNPTPIPDQPLQFNFNLWHSRSEEFAGRLDSTGLPAFARLRRLNIEAAR
ncbi:hypothetical protein C5E06_07095 [Pseudoclavibacter sp. RFBI5]|uniref:family 16 glycosylhydrolase n=1 Tax=Pseudoclavibacter sp. RFBI5 TaxID=2080578 RepID=UPI000CE7E114|nr:family 16 glycosylhydrolase [Pseudoclavibacter sp. RFBI5]PPG02258.1 hypothetical protein C5E06_07095 [Pseudoclavibacter sp. RFBI5]